MQRACIFWRCMAFRGGGGDLHKTERDQRFPDRRPAVGQAARGEGEARGRPVGEDAGARPDPLQEVGGAGRGLFGVHAPLRRKVRLSLAGVGSDGLLRSRRKPEVDQGRKPDLSTFLLAALDHSNSVETLESIENMGREKSLESVRQHALERQAAVSTDPIRRLELR